MNLFVGTIGHGSYYGSLAFIVECTNNDTLRTMKDVNEVISTLKEIKNKYDTVECIYIRCFELLKDNKLKNMHELIYGLRNEIINQQTGKPLPIIGVCSPLGIQRWIDTVNYSVLSGQFDEYPVNTYRIFQEYLVDNSPEEGTISLPVPGQQIFYCRDSVKSFVDSLKILNKAQVHRYKFYTYNTLKVGIK